MLIKQCGMNSCFQIFIRNYYKSNIQVGRPSAYIHPNPLCQPIPTRNKFRKKAKNPKFRLERAKKMIKVDLPDFHQKKEDEMTPAEMRTKLKEHGIQPHRPWNEKPLFIASTGGSMDPYVPPEGDGKASYVSTEGAKQTFEKVGKKGRSMMAVRKIRQFDEDFELYEFVEEAQKTYINLHDALMRLDEDQLHQLATERAFPLVMNDVKYKTIRWAFHGSIEPPRVVHVRYTDVITKDNIFAQITVRFHTQQTLAVYDRFGRLIHGSESLLKDVLEYVVFEKHMSNEYGIWRIHDKIVPTWMNLRPTSAFTFKVPKEELDDEEKGEEQSKPDGSEEERKPPKIPYKVNVA